MLSVVRPAGAQLPVPHLGLGPQCSAVKYMLGQTSETDSKTRNEGKDWNPYSEANLQYPPFLVHRVPLNTIFIMDHLYLEKLKTVFFGAFADTSGGVGWCQCSAPGVWVYPVVPVVLLVVVIVRVPEQGAVGIGRDVSLLFAGHTVTGTAVKSVFTGAILIPKTQTQTKDQCITDLDTRQRRDGSAAWAAACTVSTYLPTPPVSQVSMQSNSQLHVVRLVG